MEVADIPNCFFVTITESFGFIENDDNISGTEDIIDKKES